ncbi:hypothetical protein [Pseudoalteromonas piscicida]|uniref:Uncharacterized protein n=1 Tax=Pseudoalteromonas piscicida TaxID=43662 RepID=A0AAD0W2M8_PSEO7|nr:hypothetical protein [Pseudoalteromonas piscicida]ASD68194.1 hypothetical protein B1L02_15005 [Pseudoalteromonas piscicida]AXR01099.1 hypothetical protein D0511_02735 [Pseudoalteromonas piscicida]
MSRISLYLKNKMIVPVAWLAIASPIVHAELLLGATFGENSKTYYVKQQDSFLYKAKATWQAERFELDIAKGHPSQLGKLLIVDDTVTAFDQSGELIWQDNKKDTDKLCLPELFGEFIKAHVEQLLNGEKLKCLGPVLKAKKLAPFTVSYKGEKAGKHRFQVGPGSLGMWLFMDSVDIYFNENLNRIVSYAGVTPAPVNKHKKMAYLEFQGALYTDNQVALIRNSPLW